MARIGQTLDAALKERLRAVLAGEPVTEAALRKLTEEGNACLLLVSAQLKGAERRVGELSSDPASSLADVAEALRLVTELRPDLSELEELCAALQDRARQFRAAWLS